MQKISFNINLDHSEIKKQIACPSLRSEQQGKRKTRRQSIFFQDVCRNKQKKSHNHSFILITRTITVTVERSTHQKCNAFLTSDVMIFSSVPSHYVKFQHNIILSKEARSTTTTEMQICKLKRKKIKQYLLWCYSESSQSRRTESS